MSAFPTSQVRNILQELTTYNIIYADQNAPKEAGSFARFKVLHSEGSHFNENFNPNNLGVREVGENWKSTIELIFVGSGSNEEASLFASRIGLETNTDKLFALGVSLSSKGQVVNLTNLLDKIKYQERACFEIQCNWKSIETENAGLIEHVQATMTLEAPALAPPVGITGTITVDVV